MTAEIFREWVKKIDRRVPKKSLLIVDNLSSHNVNHLELKNTEVAFLPKNSTSVTQPLDAGIIQAFKQHYRKFLKWTLKKLEETQQQSKIDLRTALEFVGTAWYDVTTNAIKNCWRRTTLIESIFQGDHQDEDDSDDEEDELVSLYRPSATRKAAKVAEEEEEIDTHIKGEELVEAPDVMPYKVNEEQEEDEDGSESMQVSTGQALASIETLKTFPLQQPYYCQLDNYYCQCYKWSVIGS